MSKYTGILCECCQKTFTDDDDVVVCPECGTPHHRECYNNLGHCVFKDKHSKDFVWKAKLPEGSENRSVVCSHCNSVNTAEAKYCIMCGTSLSPDYQYGGKYSRREGNAYNGEYSNEYHSEYHADTQRRERANSFSVDNINSRELIAYTGSSFHYYVRHFQRVLTGKISFNFAAFCFSFFYFFYRKVYKIGFALLALRVLAALPAMLCYIYNVDSAMEIMGVTLLYNAALMQKLAPISSILNSLVSFTHILAAFFANKFYLSVALKDIANFKRNNQITEGTPEYYDAIYRLGKPNFISIFVIAAFFICFYGFIGSLFTIQ